MTAVETVDEDAAVDEVEVDNDVGTVVAVVVADADNDDDALAALRRSNAARACFCNVVQTSSSICFKDFCVSLKSFDETR